MNEIEANKALVRRLYDEGINRHDAAAAAKFYSIDAKNHGHAVGCAGMQKVFEMLFSTFANFSYRIDEITTEDDRVVCKVKMIGTHRGQPSMPQAFAGMLEGVTPTGKKCDGAAVSQLSLS